MSRDPKQMLFALAAALMPLAAAAQAISGMKVEPAEATPGVPVKITVSGAPTGDTANCGLRLHFGDGQTRDFKITDAAMLPLVVEHSYATAGRYTVMAEPKRVTTHLKCIGDNQHAAITVVAPAPPAVAVAAAATGLCPDGWRLDARSTNRKTGAFSCVAKAGTTPPPSRLACPGELSYFENVKKGQLGCRA